jgi:serine/threonine-protein kinase
VEPFLESAQVTEITRLNENFKSYDDSAVRVIGNNPVVVAAVTSQPSFESSLTYRLEERIAVGGMAEVFRATASSELGFTKSVVIKRLIPSLAHDPEAVRSFENELRVGVLLDHPNLLHVSDAGTYDGAPFLVTDYVRGVDLEALCYRSGSAPVPLEIALYIVIEIAEALEYAHGLTSDNGDSLGLIHRDVSPANIMLTTKGEAKLVDFGVAKSRLTGGHTQFGVIKGKPPYMSPEQCLRGQLDGRTDVFSLGIVLYELVTGRGLFRDLDDERLVMQSIVSGAFIAPALERVDDSEVEAVLGKALAVEPSLRYQTAGAMKKALSSIPVAAMRARQTLEDLVRAHLATRASLGDDATVVTREPAHQTTEVAPVPIPITDRDTIRYGASAGSALTPVDIARHPARSDCHDAAVDNGRERPLGGLGLAVLILFLTALAAGTIATFVSNA